MPSLHPETLNDFSPPVKFATFAFAAPVTDKEVVAAVAGKKIRVLAWNLFNHAATVTDVDWQSGDVTIIGRDGTTAINYWPRHAYSRCGHFETVAGAELKLTLSASGTARGHVTYIEV